MTYWPWSTVYHIGVGSFHLIGTDSVRFGFGWAMNRVPWVYYHIYWYVLKYGERIRYDKDRVSCLIGPHSLVYSIGDVC